MNRFRRRGFTLIEILMVVGITGIIFAAGIAPLVYTVRMIKDEQARFSKENMERIAFSRIVNDLVQANSLNHASPVVVMKSERLAQSERDALVIWSNGAVLWSEPIGNVVYAIPKRDESGLSKPSSLKRWVVSTDITSDSDLSDVLKDVRSTTLVEGAQGFSVEILRGSEWEKDYIGGVPQAVRVTFIHDDDTSNVYQAWLPSIGQ